MRLIILVSIAVFIDSVFGKAMPKPQGAKAAPPAGAQPSAQELQMLVNNYPKSGLVGLADNIGAGLANFGNGQGSAFDAIISGLFNAFGSLLSGMLGSGAINTAFMNYNNRPPADSGAAAAPKAGAAGGAAGAGAAGAGTGGGDNAAAGDGDN